MLMISQTFRCFIKSLGEACLPTSLTPHKLTSEFYEHLGILLVSSSGPKISHKKVIDPKARVHNKYGKRECNYNNIEISQVVSCSLQDWLAISLIRYLSRFQARYVTVNYPTCATIEVNGRCVCRHRHKEPVV